MEHSGLNKEVPYDDLLLRKAFGESVQLYRTTPKPFYSSRGCVVFVPDIVYKVGHPGESAYNCIVSGAKSMCQQFQFVDSTKMAIQGQSWGGYQTAYLVTRTNLFCAAGAGARSAT